MLGDVLLKDSTDVVAQATSIRTRYAPDYLGALARAVLALGVGVPAFADVGFDFDQRIGAPRPPPTTSHAS